MMISVRGVNAVPHPDRGAGAEAPRARAAPTRIVLTKEGSLDVMTLNVEPCPETAPDLAALESAKAALALDIKALIGVERRGECAVGVNGIERSVGKARRVVDRRNLEGVRDDRWRGGQSAFTPPQIFLEASRPSKRRPQRRPVSLRLTTYGPTNWAAAATSGRPASCGRPGRRRRRRDPRNESARTPPLIARVRCPGRTPAGSSARLLQRARGLEGRPACRSGIAEGSTAIEPFRRLRGTPSAPSRAVPEARGHHVVRRHLANTKRGLTSSKASTRARIFRFRPCLDAACIVACAGVSSRRSSSSRPIDL